MTWRRPAIFLLGQENYDTLRTIRLAWRARRTEQADDARRAELYGRWVGPGGLVFDIGANRGNRTRVFAGLGARVVALEPQRHCARALRWLFLGQRRVRIVSAAAGRDNTPKTITQFSADEISSMNPDWVASVRDSGRFGDMQTVRVTTVPCVTLDQLIARHGVPTFIKIDVEGYEAEVLGGLSQPGGTISFEVTPEMVVVALACIERLGTLGYTRFQFSEGESMQLPGPWLDQAGIRASLQALAGRPVIFGDIYALAPHLTD